MEEPTRSITSTGIGGTLDDVARTVTVKVFQAEILSNEIEPSSVTVYDQSFNPLNQVKVENYAEFLDSEKAS
ncbi:hypothetical protein [Corynebacterium propinquum]